MLTKEELERLLGENIELIRTQKEYIYSNNYYTMVYWILTNSKVYDLTVTNGKIEHKYTFHREKIGEKMIKKIFGHLLEFSAPTKKNKSITVNNQGKPDKDEITKQKYEQLALKLW